LWDVAWLLSKFAARGVERSMDQIDNKTRPRQDQDWCSEDYVRCEEIDSLLRKLTPPVAAVYRLVPGYGLSWVLHTVLGNSIYVEEILW